MNQPPDPLATAKAHRQSIAERGQQLRDVMARTDRNGVVHPSSPDRDVQPFLEVIDRGDRSEIVEMVRHLVEKAEGAR